MPILLLPIFLFGLVISWIVYLGVQQANEITLAARRDPDANASRQEDIAEQLPRAAARQR